VRIVGPNFCVVLRLRGGVVAEAARPVSYMKGWEVARVLALAERWGGSWPFFSISAACGISAASV
jgi:hypothetical protein